MSTEKKQPKNQTAEAKATEKKAPVEAQAAEARAAAESGKESEARTNAQEKPAEGQKANEKTPETEKNQAAAKTSESKPDSLKPVSKWVNEHRLATWQSAALLRANGWADDKQVTENDFKKALAGLMSRTQGGNYGRRN